MNMIARNKMPPDAARLARYATRRPGAAVVRDGLKSMLYKRLTSGSLGLFMRGQDDISVEPHTTGRYESNITGLIEEAAGSGYDGFLIDIGANIGLTAFQSGPAFRQVHMFEPNPVCVHVLRANAAIALRPGQGHIHPFALGDREGSATLRVPRSNWGGAFLAGEAHGYSDAVLAVKDGYGTFEPENYFDVEVHSRPATPVLEDLFATLAAAGLTSGVIKLDVEGFEGFMLDTIAATLPPDFSAVIVFENWDPDIDLARLGGAFSGRAQGYRLREKVTWNRRMPRMLNLALLLGRQVRVGLVPWSKDCATGDMVMLINPSGVELAT